MDAVVAGDEDGARRARVEHLVRARDRVLAEVRQAADLRRAVEEG
jgi:DNA-binding GntR family transcriptional regulator